jgi:hypothetical protein
MHYVTRISYFMVTYYASTLKPYIRLQLPNLHFQETIEF